MQKGRLTNTQISLVLGLVSPGIKVGMLKAVLSVDLLILGAGLAFAGSRTLVCAHP